MPRFASRTANSISSPSEVLANSTRLGSRIGLRKRTSTWKASGRRDAGFDVEANVAEDKRIVFECDHVGDEGVAQLLGQAVEVGTEADGAEELGGLRRHDVPWLQPAARRLEAGASEPLLRLLGRRAARPTPAEVEANPRAESARLRVVERVEDAL